MNRPTPTCLALARHLHGLAERADLPRPEVQIVREELEVVDREGEPKQ